MGNTSPRVPAPRPGRAYQRIVDGVEADLYAGRLRPGDRLPSEREMVAKYGVSRATVREALRVLEHSGLIRSRHGDPGGPVVLALADGPLVTAMTRAARLRGGTLGDVLGFRMVLESAANRLAARLRTAEQLERMDACLDAMRAAIDGGRAEFAAADFAFHQVVAEAAGNAMIQAGLDAARSAVLVQIDDRLGEADDVPAQMAESLRHHRLVFEAVRDGDGERASEIAKHSLFAYYAHHLDPDERAALEDLRGNAPSPL